MVRWDKEVHVQPETASEKSGYLGEDLMNMLGREGRCITQALKAIRAIIMEWCF